MLKTLIIVTTLSFMYCSNTQKQDESIAKDVTVEEFKKLVDSGKGLLLDVRTPDEFNEGHIMEAVNINFYDKDFAQQVEKLDKMKPVYVYCRSGGRSGKTKDLLHEKGFTKVYNLEGGILSWEKAGYKITN